MPPQATHLNNFRSDAFVVFMSTLAPVAFELPDSSMRCFLSFGLLAVPLFAFAPPLILPLTACFSTTLTSSCVN